MALTIDERKDRYYKLVLDRGTAVYSSWKKHGVASKRLAARAREISESKSFKTDYGYRFQALVFAYALSLRVEKRYGTFLRKLFLYFAYHRERKALALLKRIWGLQDFADMRDMIALESERVSVEISHLIDRESMHGGRRFAMDEVTLDEELQNFIEECIQEEKQKTLETELETSDAESVEIQDGQTSLPAEEMEREKISIKEFEPTAEKVETGKKEPKPTKTERLEKEETSKETEVSETVKETKTEEKLVVETPIVVETETVVTEQEREAAPSPFPIFREPVNKAPVTDKKEARVVNKEQNETKPEREKSGNVSKSTREELERQKTPFPIFRDPHKPAASAAPTEAKPVEPTKIDLNRVESKPAWIDTVSEENRARITSNVTMSEEQIGALATQIQEQAKEFLAQEELAWREKISVSEGVNKAPTNVQSTSNTRNNNPVAPSHKK